MNEEFIPKGFVEVHEITDIVSFLKSVDWTDSFLYLLIGFHVLVSLTILLTRRRINLHVFMFLTLLVLVYISEYLNEVAAANWQLFSKQQYFDSNGLFISVTYSSPILLNCLLLLANFFHQNFELMKTLRQAQLRQQQELQKNVKSSPNPSKLKTK